MQNQGVVIFLPLPFFHGIATPLLCADFPHQLHNLCDLPPSLNDVAAASFFPRHFANHKSPLKPDPQQLLVAGDS